MPKTIVKIKKSTSDTLNEISEMYKEIFLNSKLSTEVITTKFNTIVNLITEFRNNLINYNKLLIDNHIFIDLKINVFIDSINSLLQDSVISDPTTIQNNYNNIINSPTYKTIIQSCVSIKNVYENLNEIKNGDDQNVKLFTFSDFSIKLIYDTDNKNLENIFLQELKKMYDNVYKISQEIFKPDIDIDNTCNLIEKSLDVLKSRVHRCDRAIGIIRSSLGMFREKFPVYFKEAKISGNESYIIMNFFSDLSSKENLKKYKSATLAREFRVIMNYLCETNKQLFKEQPHVDMLMQTAMQYLQLSEPTKT